MKFKIILPLLLIGVMVVMSSYTHLDNLYKLTGGSSKKWLLRHYLLNEYQLEAFKCLENNAEFEFRIDKTLKKKHHCNADSQVVILNDTFNVTGEELFMGSEKFEIVELTYTSLRIKKQMNVKIKGPDELKIENAEKVAAIEIIFETK